MKPWLRSSRWVFALAFLAGLYQVLFPSGFGFGPGWEAVAIARELVHTGQFANPFQSGPSGPTAMLPPLFPLFLAFWMKLLGDTPAFALTASCLAVFALALNAALLPRVAFQLFGDARPGVLAGLFAAGAFRLMPQWDVQYTCCAILLFLLNTSLATRGAAIGTGLAVGLLLLTNPATMLITLPWLLYLYTRQKPGLAIPAIVAATIVLTTLPWMLRNQTQAGTFSIKNNLGFTLYVSNSDCALAALAEGPASPCMSARNPNKSTSELAVLNQLGETRYDATRKADAITWIRTHPAAFVRLTAARFVGFWFPPEDRTYIVWLVTVLSLPGLFLMVRRRVAAAPWLLGTLALYPALYYLVVIDIRYRYPVLWISLLAAGYAVTEFATAISQRVRRTNTTYPEPPSPQTDARPAHT